MALIRTKVNLLWPSFLLVVTGMIRPCSGWAFSGHQRAPGSTRRHSLSSEYLENDLIAIQIPTKVDGGDDNSSTAATLPRLCAVRPDGGVYPLCKHEDDVETDLFVDPRVSSQAWTEDVIDADVTSTYGEGWYGQRPVPSLGGGPGYGAEADPVWSIDEDILERLQEDGVELPVLDVGIAHGEKARGGAF